MGFTFKRLFAFFLRGLVFTMPIGLTAYIIYYLLKIIDRIIPTNIPGLGFIILIVSITLLGWLGTTIIAQPIVNYVKKLLDKVPLIKIIYSSINDLLSAFVGNKKRFNKPVLVKMNKDADIEKLGFITQEDLSVLGISKEKIAVYLPHSFNFSGNLFIVPKENITVIDASSADMMKFIVSGGITDIGHSDKS